jgi:hemerythrin superfamily protein
MQRMCPRSHGRRFGATERGLLAGPAMNAIELLKMQHQQVKEALEKMSEGEIDKDEVRLLADELVAHMVIEEHVFYPRIQQLKKDLVSESYEEHAVARFELARAMVSRGEDQKTRLTVLKELIEHHVKEEEEEMFPKVQKAIAAEELERLGERMEQMFDKAVEAGIEKLVVGNGIELIQQRMQGKTNGARMTARPGRAAARGKTKQARGGRSARASTR